MGSAEVDKHTPPSGDGAGKDMLTGLSNGMDRHKSKDKDHHSHKHKHKDKDREKSKDKSRDKHKDKHKDKHRDKDKHKDKSKDKDRKHDKEERKQGKEDRKHSKEDRKVEKEEKKKGKDKSKDKAEKSQYVEVKNEPLSEDDDVPLASRSFSQTSQDSEDDDQPLAFRQKVKTEVKPEVKAEKPVKRKAEDLDDDDFSASKKKTKKVKEEKKEKKEKANKKPATPNGSPTKRAKKEKEEEETWKWWEEEKHEDGVKWKSLEHKGPVFATQYEPLPGNVKFKYNGQEMKLSTAAEEVGSFYAAMLDHDYVTKDVFNKNFFKDWRKFMTHSEKEIITDLKKCDFTYMLTYFKAKSEERKNRTKEEKLQLKTENEEMVKEYGWCIIDGHKQRIGNFKIEPPDSVDKIRETYKEDWKSKEMKIRQRSVALYFIDKLALRAGNEKDEDQADTVGACSLRVEHISLHEQKEGKQCVVVFDFLGKDSIRYYNEVPVEKRVFKNLQIFMENKKPGDDLFDRLNILAYNRANRAVAILCNHQRAVPKTFAKSMENLQVKITAKREAIEDAEKSFKDLKKEAKKTGSAAAKIAAGKKEKQVEKLKEQLMKLEVQATDREENKEIALGTSKLNYLDPRISVAWCKKNDVPIEKIYNKTQREKFQWAIDMAGPEFVF
uniref:DNA topoisomerase 1 n=1 Tax=Daphnia pulex TaxID=6669 RepID=A0A4Y7MVP5_DAPPU|nr:EOG090X0296 [Daphnia pulex]SVE84742.1 EOG090X0296 [Daphnia pulex]